MEKQRIKQKRKKDRNRSSALPHQIPDAPTLEEFECLLGESPSSYPKGEGIENIESELRSAAIDTEAYGNDVDLKIIDETTPMLNSHCRSVDEVDTSLTVIASAPEIDDIQESLYATTLSEPPPEEAAPTAPILDDVPTRSIEHSFSAIVDNQILFQNEHELEVNSSTELISEKNLEPLSESQLAALYSNEELNLIEAFVDEFVEYQLKSHPIRQQHRLHELLMNYLRVRNHLITNSHELEYLKNSCKDIQKQLWCLDKTAITENGECQDGNPVNATHEYTIAHFNHQNLAALSRSLSTIKESLHNVQTLHCYESETLKLQIEHYIQRVCLSCKEFAHLPHNAPVILSSQDTLQTTPQLVELRTCITILFNFQRKTLKDEKFVNDTREWLSKLVAVLLRVATWQDHLFLLNHVIRCPGGVSNWAKSFIQIPVPSKTRILSTSPFDDSYLNHMIATLGVILFPIKEREHFLDQVQQTFQENMSNNNNNNDDAVWVILDEEGEEDEDMANTGMNLLESDIISFLQQIPLDKLFEQILYVENTNDSFHHDMNLVTEHHMLKMFAFSTVFIRMIKKGLKTYDSPRYRQLTKRLSALIRDIVQYASDLWESFDKSRISDPSMLERLQTEYDFFFMRATLCIFSSRRLGAWQYLAAIPYHLISINNLWQLLYVLHTDSTTEVISCKKVSEWQEEFRSVSVQNEFEEKLSSFPADESYFLLTTFANMAMSRTKQDYEFIRAITLDLFQIGFLNTKTQDSCSKDARSLLSNLTSKYPSLLSDIIRKLKDNFSTVGKLSIYLFTELSISTWPPNEEDLKILSNWLHKFSLSCVENHLARLIISHLNWGFDSNGNLNLPIDLHRNVALLITELLMKYASENSTQNASLLSEGVKQVSSMVRPQSSEYIFCNWAWETVSRLRLHLCEQSDQVCQFAISNASRAFSQVPDIESNSSLDILIRGIREKQPIAIYVALRMTLCGHSVPIICSKAFDLMQILQSSYKYDQILIILSNFLPLFLESPESLLKNEKAIALIHSCVSADRTYMKMAKNFIAPDFPGPILKSFTFLIEYHLQNYRKFCLRSPEPLIKLWLNILVLVPDWNRDQNALHLIDTVIRASFFHAESRKVVEGIFQHLYMIASSGIGDNINVPRNSSSLGSFINWATGSSQSPSLLGGSIQSIWVAYQILFTEQQEREIKSGLWRELLRELSSQMKSSLDSSLKKACATMKIQPFNPNSLSIYKWSQQALDTPMDHPLLPILWQHFFALFLARVPSATGIVDKGGVGDKFFEGMMNLSYLKKIKKRLLETTEYFQSKGEKDLDDGKLISEERRIFYFNTAKYYKTLSLWLEEPRLQEAGLFLPALPPQYMSQKLVLVLQGNENPWLEYIDYFTVQQNRTRALKEWERICCRDFEAIVAKPTLTPTTPVEPIDPIHRIFRRLNSYEHPIAPPALGRSNVTLSDVPRDCLYNSESAKNLLQVHLKTVLEYTQIFNLLLSEHTAIDCSFIELVPTLYKQVENSITLHALCDPITSGNKKSRSGTPPIVHCAGPAVIRIKISEARVNDGVDNMISRNRAEYDNLLVKANQPPPSKVIQSCVYIDYFIAVLEYELNNNRTNETNKILQKVQSTGTEIFYTLVQFYNEEASLCPPIKQLITSGLEKLGQLFVAGEEIQGPRLLNTILERPSLGGLLGPHFTPVAGGASTFLQMYQTVVELSSSNNVDLCFVLLSKFDVSSWLNYRRPRLSERSTFIELVNKALCNIGVTPEDDKLMLHEIFRNHLRSVLLHEFPEHYGEVLSAILRGSESQSLSLEIWKDFLNVISAKPKNSSLVQPGKLRDEIRRYATEQRLLSKQEIHDTAILLSKHFMNERLQYGLYGLYPKYRTYNEPITTFLGMIAHALVVLTLHSDRGTLADHLCEKIWPVLSDMFSPWITPYWSRNLREPTAAWIQQLTDDRSVLLPWIITDGPHANKSVAMFVECIRFITDTMPASSRIFTSVWQFYVNNFAHVSVKDHILNVIHGNLLSLPWDRFVPTINDIELMVKVIDQYLPDSHLFLGSIFMTINWPVCINDIIACQPAPTIARVHACFLNLLVKLSNEPNVRQNEKTLGLLSEAEKFSWHTIDASSYDQIINWHVMSCDPKVVLNINGDSAHAVDLAVNNLLKIAAGYDATLKYFHSTTLKKRQIYVRYSMKLLVNCSTRYKSLVSTNTKAFSNSLSRMLDEMEVVVTNSVSGPQQVPEAGLLVTELFQCLNQNNVLIEHLRLSWTTWLAKRSANSPILLGILRVIGMVVPSPSILGEIIESALDAYFRQILIEDNQPTWGAVLTIMQPLVPRQPPIESVLVAEGRVLALYAIFLKRLPSCNDIREEGMLLTNLIEWITNIKPTGNIEEKLPLLWSKALELIYRQCQYSESTVVACRALKGLSKALLLVADDAGQGWGFLGAIGLRKGSQLTTRCKFLSRALAIYCLAQLPESNGQQQLVRFTPHSPGVALNRNHDSEESADVRPSGEAVKAMLILESLLTNKQYAELKGDIEQAICMIRDSANSLHNAVQVVGALVADLYSQRYLHVITD